MAMTTPSYNGGYDYNFVNQPNDIVICKICYLVSREPCLSICCGHTFCKSCVDYIKKGACPICRSENFEAILNKQAAREINNYLLYCTNKEKGCKWQGKLGSISNHLGNSDGCQFEEIKCSNECGKIIERRYLTSHVETECPKSRYQIISFLNTTVHSLLNQARASRRTVPAWFLKIVSVWTSVCVCVCVCVCLCVCLCVCPQGYQYLVA